MSERDADPDEFVPLSNLEFHVLLALGDGPAHGYGVGKEVEERSGGELKPTTGALYQALKRLADDGLVTSADAEVESSDSRRKYFRLTGLGREVAALEARRLSELVDVARSKRLFPGST